MALLKGFNGFDGSNASGQVPDSSTSAADSDAKAIYASGSATRMQRMAGTGTVAAQHTTGDGASNSVSAAFISGEGHSWTKL